MPTLETYSNYQKQLANLETQLTTSREQITSLQDKNNQLQTELDSAKTASGPKLVTRLGVKDVRISPAQNHPWSGRIRFYIAVEVWNVGSEPAKNACLHVTLYQGETIANETWIRLGTIDSASYADVSTNIYYNGQALSNWTIIPQFT